MIYKARELLAHLNNLVLAGSDGCGVLEWIGNDLQWHKAEVESLSASELQNANEIAESDEYDYRTQND